MAVTRFFPQDCRIAIPQNIRERLDLHPGDLLSFSIEKDSILIRKEKLCDACAAGSKNVDLDAFFDSLSPEQQQSLVSSLARKLLTRKGGERRGRN